jgi:hypothetical protein
VLIPLAICLRPFHTTEPEVLAVKNHLTPPVPLAAFFAAFLHFFRFPFFALRPQIGRCIINRLYSLLSVSPFFNLGRRPMKLLYCVMDKIRFNVAALD